MRTAVSSIIIMLGLICLLGCGKEKKPAGFPETVPFTLTVHRDGSPLSDATVQLIPEQGTVATTGGKTNSNGVVVLHTVCGTYTRPGSPVGTFKIVVNKTPEIKMESNPGKPMTQEETDAYNKKLAELINSAKPEIAAKFTAPDTTPLSITVEPGSSATVKVTAR